MWNSVNQIIEALNEIEYVFLRNSESIAEDFDESDDWDILCRDKKEMVNALEAVPLVLNSNCYNYYTLVNQKKLLLDIRCVGDGYFDKNWENEMLNRRKEKTVYVLDSENQKYSVLYHALVHKEKSEAEKYKKYILSEFSVFDDETNINQLGTFMNDHNYAITKPLDDGVYINEMNVNRIMEKLYGRKNKKSR